MIKIVKWPEVTVESDTISFDNEFARVIEIVTVKGFIFVEVSDGETLGDARDKTELEVRKRDERIYGDLVGAELSDWQVESVGGVVRMFLEFNV